MKEHRISKGVITVLIACLYVFQAKGQQDSLTVEEPAIVAMARPQQDGKIMLRWAAIHLWGRF